jgi:hypothetical protein
MVARNDIGTREGVATGLLQGESAIQRWCEQGAQGRGQRMLREWFCQMKK